jgi:hypothetical protein
VSGPNRGRLIFVAVLVVVFVPVVVVLAASGGGGDKRPRGLRIDIGTDYLSVYVMDPSLNTAKVADGRDKVTLDCRDRSGKVVSRSDQLWPFAATDGGQAPPHVHVNAPRARETASCRLLGTNPPVGGTRRL